MDQFTQILNAIERGDPQAAEQLLPLVYDELRKLAARKQGERLRAGFERLARKYGVIGDIRGKGLLQAIEFVRNLKTKEPFPPDAAFGLRVGRRALDNGLLCRFDPHWLAFGPPLVVTSEQIDEMVELLDKSIAEVLSEMES